MKTLFEHIEHAKGKPHHVRERIAFGVASGVSGLIALVWLTGSLNSGKFALQDTSFADAVNEPSAVVVGQGNERNNSLAGAAAALPSAAKNVPAYIKIVDATASSSTRQTEQTTIPF